MRVIVVGLGIQGKKREAIAGTECVATVDPFNPAARYKKIEDVPRETYDAALICTPDEAKIEILDYLLSHKKHVLVEKPLIAPSNKELKHLLELASKNHTTCYTAYNHRFEPHIVKMKELIQSHKLGQLYCCKLFYGNGTARDVRNSPWRDQKGGVLKDLGSHLLDAVLFLFGQQAYDFRVIRKHRFENKSPDHVIIGTEKSFPIDLEMSLLSWRNHFTCDVIGEHGSAHIESLCKWGPSKFVVRMRKLPSGRPDEETVTLVQPDPTWNEEYKHFKELCKKGESNLSNDLFINETLLTLGGV